MNKLWEAILVTAIIIQAIAINNLWVEFNPSNHMAFMNLGLIIMNVATMTFNINTVLNTHNK